MDSGFAGFRRRPGMTAGGWARQACRAGLPPAGGPQEMNNNSIIQAAEEAPILLVPYMWIGDFVRCHSVVKLLRARYPRRPVDVITTTLNAPLLDYMPGVRKGI